MQTQTNTQAKAVADRLQHNCQKLVEEAFWNSDDASNELRDMILDSFTLRDLLQTIQMEYAMELRKKEENVSYTDGANGTIKWIDFGEREPELPGEYLAHLDGGVIIRIFRDKEGQYCEYPTMDDVDDWRFTHWAEVNYPCRAN